MLQGPWREQDEIIALLEEAGALGRETHRSFSEDSGKALCPAAESEDAHTFKGGQKEVCSCVYAKYRVYSCILIYSFKYGKYRVYSCIIVYCIIFRTNNCKPTFAHPCKSNRLELVVI